MSRLPPGSDSVSLSSLRYLREPYASMLDAVRRYGDPYRSASFFGRMVVTSDPAAIRTLFTADPDTYLALGADLLGPILGESNLILLSGERHRAMRQLQMPPFHGSRMRLYGQIIHDITREHIGRWPTDRPFSLHATAQEISLQVILQAVVGLAEPTARSEFQTAVLAVVDALKPSFMFLPALRRRLFGWSAWARFLRSRERLTEIFFRELARRRAADHPGEDILSLLLSATFDDGAPLGDDDLLIQIINLIVAGHETTASALAWAFHHIHRDPVVLQRLRDEVRLLPRPFDAEAVARLPYLEAVCSETLRINPVAPLIGRVLSKPMTLQGYEIPPGFAVGIGVLLVHRRPDLYPEPEQFRPERFLSRTYSPFEYLPFGGGARRCLGAAFAQYEMKIILATILAEKDLRLEDAPPVRPVVRNTTVGPSGGIPMRQH